MCRDGIAGHASSKSSVKSAGMHTLHCSHLPLHACRFEHTDMRLLVSGRTRMRCVDVDINIGWPGQTAVHRGLCAWQLALYVRKVATYVWRVQNGLSRHFFDIWCNSEKNSCVLAGYCCCNPTYTTQSTLSYTARYLSPGAALAALVSANRANRLYAACRVAFSG